jgi:hypothetical protein
MAPGAILALVAAAGLAACSSPQSADNIADAHGLAASENVGADYTPVPKTTVVGSIIWANPVDSMGVVEINADTAPLPPGTILMSRDPHTLKPSGLMQTTDQSSKRIEGVTLINGIPAASDEVIEPGPELKPQVDYNMEQNRLRMASQKEVNQGPDNPPVDNTANGTGSPNQGIAPGM